MSDARSNHVMAFIKGRSNRRQYWLAILLLMVGNMVLGAVHTPALVVSAVSMPFWLVVAGRRLHDFDRRWWWGLIPFVFGLLFGFVQGLASSALGGAAIPPLAETAIYFAVTLVVVVTLGGVPGSSGPNRYGPPVGVGRPPA